MRLQRADLLAILFHLLGGHHAIQALHELQKKRLLGEQRVAKGAVEHFHEQHLHMRRPIRLLRYNARQTLQVDQCRDRHLKGVAQKTEIQLYKLIKDYVLHNVGF